MFTGPVRRDLGEAPAKYQTACQADQMKRAGRTANKAPRALPSSRAEQAKTIVETLGQSIKFLRIADI